MEDLIDRTNGGWNEEVVRDWFLPSDMEHILSIPVCNSWPNNKLMWYYNANGEFSVKSAYYGARRLKKVIDASYSSNGGREPWKFILNVRAHKDFR